MGANLRVFHQVGQQHLMVRPSSLAYQSSHHCYPVRPSFPTHCYRRRPGSRAVHQLCDPLPSPHYTPCMLGCVRSIVPSSSSKYSRTLLSIFLRHPHLTCIASCFCRVAFPMQPQWILNAPRKRCTSGCILNAVCVFYWRIFAASSATVKYDTLFILS